MTRTTIAACLIALAAHSAASAALRYQLTDLGTLGGDSSYATAINDNGTAVGYLTLVGDNCARFCDLAPAEC